MDTAFDLVWFAAERTPDHMAIVDDRSDRAWTYRRLMHEVDAVAAGLAARGVGPGTRFATALPNLFDHCLAILALGRLGAVPALINARLGAADIATLVTDGAIEAALILPDADLAEAVAAALPDGAPLFCVGPDCGGAEDFSGVRGDAARLAPRPTPEPEDLAYIFYTSGTTGLPKGVMIPHRTTHARTVWISALAGLRCGAHNRVLGLAPLAHAIGFYGNFLVALAYNGTYFVVSQFDPGKAVEAVAAHRISFLFTVPTFYVAMVNAPGYAPAKMASLEHVLFGGAAINPQLLARLDDEWPATLRHIYGTTETMCMLYNPEPVGQSTRLRPGLYSRIRVVEFGGDAEAQVAPGGEGELIVDASADPVFTGYLGRPEATAEKVRQGWYFTGDVCVRHADGDVELIGRVDDVIRTGGENVHPEEVEPVLSRHPGVAEVSVVGIEDDYWGQMVVACVVRADGSVGAEDLDAYCKSGPLARFKRPRAYLFVDALPRNAANKVLRRVLRDDAAGAAAPGATGDLQRIDE